MYKFIFFNDYTQVEFDKLQPAVAGLQAVIEAEVVSLKSSITGIYNCSIITYNSIQYEIIVTSIRASFPGIVT